MRRLLAVAAAIAAAAPAASAMGSAGPEPAVTLAVSRSAAPHGARIQATGTVQPAAGGETVVLELHRAGRWSQVARGVVGWDGTFEVEVRADTGGTLLARAIEAGAISEPVELAVVPKVTVKTRPGLAFGGARLAARIRPTSYSGRVEITVSRNGKVVASTTVTAARGRLRTTVPTPGMGRFDVRVVLPAAGGLAERTVAARVSAEGRVLGVGSTGPDVRGLTRRLRELRFHAPAPSETFGWELTDAVIAFQKAYGLTRTGIVDRETWRKLTTARQLRPRYTRPGDHIEVDKTRQILLHVRGGEVAAVIPVSSGATGNTPEGRHAVRWKALATTTWLGPGILYRTMTFHGNSFAIHGWSSVPAYPASHGCVRIPIWTADWLYNRTPVGETVYVYS